MLAVLGTSPPASARAMPHSKRLRRIRSGSMPCHGRNDGRYERHRAGNGDPKHVRPAIPIVIVSGHTGSGVAARALAAGARETLQKPVMSADMAECLARALGDARVTRA